MGVTQAKFVSWPFVPFSLSLALPLLQKQRMTANLLSFNPLTFPSSLTTIKSMNGFSTLKCPKTCPPPFHQDLRITHLHHKAYHWPSAVPTNPKSQIRLPCSRITCYFVPNKTIPHILLPSDSLHKPKSQILRAAAETPQDMNPEADLSPSKNKTLQLAVIFGLWYFQSIVFNIYTKKVLNVFPFPWLLASFQLLTGSIWMFFVWSLKLQPCPRIYKEFIFALLGPALFHTIAFICAAYSFSKVAISFTHVIKSSEPVFSVIFSSFLGDNYPMAVWLSTLPIIFGCSLAAVTEVSFNHQGLWGALISNVGSVLRIIYSKKSLQIFKEVNGLNLYGCISLVSLIYLFPVAVLVEGSLWVAGYHRAIELVGQPSTFYLWLVLSGIFYHLYNQSSYQALDDISPLTFSVGNTMKRVVVIVSAVLVFRNPVRPLNALGSAIAILGTLLYSQASGKKSGSKKKN